MTWEHCSTALPTPTGRLWARLWSSGFQRRILWRSAWRTRCGRTPWRTRSGCCGDAVPDRVRCGGRLLFLPPIFVRVRSPEQLLRLAEEYAPFSSILRGFILPKFFLENCGAYLAAIRSIGRTEEYFYMPVFESAAMIPPQTRREALTEVQAQLDTVSGSILNIRVGGNDLSHAFGLRRPANRTIYDLRPVADILIDIVAAFGTQYVVSGPVWEYYSGEGWEEGLRREMELDLLNGFTGKTVIHPNQIPVVNEMLRVSPAGLRGRPGYPELGYRQRQSGLCQ